MKIRVLFLIFTFCVFKMHGVLCEEEMPQGMGLAVEPGGILMQRVPPGELFDIEAWTKVKLKIYNNSDKARRFSIKVDKPSRLGLRTLKGYSEIPNPSWFWLEEHDVLVKERSISEIKMFLKIPADEKYYNQKWAVGMDVEGRPEGEEQLALAVSPLYYIETAEKADIRERPSGFLGVAPGVVILDNISLGKKTQVKVRLFNNDMKPHKYKVSAMTPLFTTEQQVIVPSPGFSWLPEIKWVKPTTRNIKLKAQETKELKFDIQIPKDNPNYLGQRWEVIIFFEDEEGNANFTRVQITTAKF